MLCSRAQNGTRAVRVDYIQFFLFFPQRYTFSHSSKWFVPSIHSCLRVCKFHLTACLTSLLCCGLLFTIPVPVAWWREQLRLDNAISTIDGFSAMNFFFPLPGKAIIPLLEEKKKKDFHSSMISWKVIDELIIFVSIKVTVDTRYTLRKRCAEFESTLEFVTVLIRTCKMEKRVPNCPTDSYVIFSRYEVSHDHVPGILVETAAYRKSRSKWQEMECTLASTFKRFMCMYVYSSTEWHPLHPCNWPRFLKSSQPCGKKY